MSAGLLQLGLDFNKSVREASKLKADAMKLSAEAFKARAEGQEIERRTPSAAEAELKRFLELRERELQVLKLERELGALPAASLVPTSTLLVLAQNAGITAEAAAHVCNRALPAALSATSAIGSVSVVRNGVRLDEATSLAHSAHSSLSARNVAT